MMRPLVAGLALLFAGGACATDDNRMGHAPDVLALVNADIITLAERDRVRTDLLASADRRGLPGDSSPIVDSLDQQALQNLIDRRLMLQEAQRQQLSVTRKELDDAISELRGRFEDLQNFGAWMGERGLDDALLFDTVADDILLRRVRSVLVKDVSVSEDQVHEFYAEHEDGIVIGQEVRLAIISVSSVEVADAILGTLRDGFDFHTLAREHSQGQRAAQGGDTGWIDFTTLPPALQEVVAGLQEGEASRPVRKNDDEFLIVALADRRPVHAANVVEAYAAIERHLLQIERQDTFTAWLRQRHQESNIEIFEHGQ